MNAGSGAPAPAAVSGISPMSAPLGGPSAGSAIWITESDGEPSGNLFTTKMRFVAASYATPSGAPPLPHDSERVTFSVLSRSPQFVLANARAPAGSTDTA